jgi:predicted amidohydrolase
MPDKVKIAAVQMNPVIMQNKNNLDKILAEARTAAGNGADLIVFPECALSGYVFSSREEAMPFMETIPGPATDKLAACCKELGVHVIFGLLEKDGDKCFNAAVLIGPAGLIGKYDLPPENQSSDNVRLDNKERGYFIGQKTIQIRANHQQAPRG